MSASRSAVSTKRKIQTARVVLMRWRRRDQTRMPGKKPWSPVRRHFPVDQFNEREEKRRLAHSEEKRREHIARPMRTEINPRPGEGRDKRK